MSSGKGRQLPRAIQPSDVRIAKPTVLGNACGMEINSSFINGFPYAVCVGLRNGLSVSIPPTLGTVRFTNDFVVRITYRFSVAVNIDVHRLFDAVSESSDAHVKVLGQALKDSRARVAMGANECAFEYAISRGQFEQHGSAVYIDDLDITLFKEENAEQGYHPNSPQGRQLCRSEQAGNGFFYQLDIVDPDRIFGDRFINIAGKIHRITARTDTSKPPGVYLFSSFPEGERVVGEFGVCRHYSFQDADKDLAMFRTWDEAKTLGDQSEARKREFEELQHRMRMDEHQHKAQMLDKEREFEEQNNKHKREILQRETELKTAQLSLKEAEQRAEARKQELDDAQQTIKHLREMRSMEEKDRYERRSLDRKDSSEIIKWLPAIAVGVGLLVGKLNLTAS